MVCILVVGKELNYSLFGGIVVGRLNTTKGDYPAVSGRRSNYTSCDSSSLSGDANNYSYVAWSSVSGRRDSVSIRIFLPNCQLTLAAKMIYC
jgi:hypothetical protein